MLIQSKIPSISSKRIRSFPLIVTFQYTTVGSTCFIRVTDNVECGNRRFLTNEGFSTGTRRGYAVQINRFYTH